MRQRRALERTFFNQLQASRNATTRSLQGLGSAYE